MDRVKVPVACDPMPMTAKGWFLYLARCSDGTIYTGIARDVVARMAAHDAGRGARYTRGRGPLALCAVRRCASKSEAQRLEYAVKKLPRVRKEKLLSARGLGAFCRRVGVEVAKQIAEHAVLEGVSPGAMREPSTRW